MTAGMAPSLWIASAAFAAGAAAGAVAAAAWLAPRAARGRARVAETSDTDPRDREGDGGPVDAVRVADGFEPSDREDRRP